MNNDEKKSFNKACREISHKYHFPMGVVIAIIGEFFRWNEVTADEVSHYIVDGNDYAKEHFADKPFNNVKMSEIDKLAEMLNRLFNVRSQLEGSDIPLWMKEDAFAGIDRRKAFLKNALEHTSVWYYLRDLIENMGQLNSERLSMWVVSWYTCREDKYIEELSTRLNVEYWVSKRLFFLRQEPYPVSWSMKKVLWQNGLYAKLLESEAVSHWLDANVLFVH